MIPFINIHTHKIETDAKFVFNLPTSDIIPDVEYFSFGIHPWDIEKADIEIQLKHLEKFCQNKKLIAIGEIGIDRAIKTSLEIQKEVFIQQLEIARHYNLPVLIHCVRAWSDTFEIRKSGKYLNPWIFHGFNGNVQTAHQIIKSGCYLSFGEGLIYQKKIREMLIQLPKEFVFFETDDSELKIEDIYQNAAEIYNIAVEDLKSIVLNNFKKIFISIS